MQEYGERLDAERRRKRDVILQILFEEAAQGRCYMAHQFAETFEGQAGPGANRTINERLSPCVSIDVTSSEPGAKGAGGRWDGIFTGIQGQGSRTSAGA
jgi:hypothetical protein